ncbi:hypothetical protein BLOT_002848 [Blomia tropicalis]|nr:hypothetical protein BLOT_002848 [Blomia tropicalis]
MEQILNDTIMKANKKEYKREFLQSNVYAFECEMRLKLTQQTYHLNKQIKALITHETTATAKRNHSVNSSEC